MALKTLNQQERTKRRTTLKKSKRRGRKQKSTNCNWSKKKTKKRSSLLNSSWVGHWMTKRLQSKTALIVTAPISALHRWRDNWIVTSARICTSKWESCTRTASSKYLSQQVRKRNIVSSKREMETDYQRLVWTSHQNQRSVPCKRKPIPNVSIPNVRKRRKLTAKLLHKVMELTTFWDNM